MTGDLRKSVLKLASAVVIPLVFGSCFSASGPSTGVAGGNPAAPPGPPAEVPASLRIPKDLGIDLGKVQAAEPSTSESVALKMPLKNAIPPDGEFADDVDGTSDFVQLQIDALSGLLDPYNQLIIPVGTNIHTFQGVSVVQGEGQAEFVEIKIDFSDFDFDGVSGPEGCPGHTAGLPLCMRIYADGKRQIAAVFTQFPTETNPGAGRLMGLNITNAVFLFPKDSFLGINYDLHDESVGKSTEFLVRENPDDLSGKDLRFHMALDQVGEEANSLKTVNFNLVGEEGRFAPQAVARWKEDGDLWSGRSHTNAPGSELSELDNQCVNLLTGDGVNRSECVDAGVDVGDVPFAALPDETTLFLPKDFPETPPF
ncbi:MAG TPA: hypothetical protein VLJ37_06165 [bacterium]|nr:hypothetical protein [bacterium]